MVRINRIIVEKMNLNEPKKLKRVIDKLLQKKDIYRNWHRDKQTYGIEVGEVSKDNLRKMFRNSIVARGGPPNRNQVKAGVEEFDRKLEEIIENMSDLSQENAEEKYRWLLENLTNIRGVGSKIACEYVRKVVVYGRVWEDLLYELYVPVDTHIDSFMTEKLKVFREDEIPKYHESTEFKDFQNLLDQVHSPRIDFNLLWFIGNRFCVPGLTIRCGYCPIKEYCNKWKN